jgi:hypothetical protein
VDCNLLLISHLLVRRMQEAPAPGRRDTRGRQDGGELARRFDRMEKRVGELAAENRKLKKVVKEYVKKIVRKIMRKDETTEELIEDHIKLKNKVADLKYEVWQQRAENKKKAKQIKELEREVGDLWEAKIDHEEEEGEEVHESNEAKSEEAEEEEEPEGEDSGEEGREETEDEEEGEEDSSNTDDGADTMFGKLYNDDEEFRPEEGEMFEDNWEKELRARVRRVKEYNKEKSRRSTRRKLYVK